MTRPVDPRSRRAGAAVQDAFQDWESERDAAEQRGEAWVDAIGSLRALLQAATGQALHADVPARWATQLVRLLGEVDREHDLRRGALTAWAVQASTVPPTSPLPGEPWAAVSEPEPPPVPTRPREQPTPGPTDDTTSDRGHREVRVRGVLRKQGYALRKSRLRSRESSEDYGGYMIVDVTRNTIEAGEKFDLSLDDAERWAIEPREFKRGASEVGSPLAHDGAPAVAQVVAAPDSDGLTSAEQGAMTRGDSEGAHHD